MEIFQRKKTGLLVRRKSFRNPIGILFGPSLLSRLKEDIVLEISVLLVFKGSRLK